MLIVEAELILLNTMFSHFSCFIDHTAVLFGVFLGPIFVVLLFNIVMFLLVVRVLIKHSRRKIVESKNAKKYKSTLKTLISIVSIMAMFGLSWLFGAFTISGASQVFSWLFVIFNSLQGFVLFLFFCVIGKDPREEWKSVFTCGRSRKKKRLRGTVRSKTGQGKSTANTYLTSRKSDTIKRQVQADLSSTSFANSNAMELSADKPLTSIAEEADVPNGLVETDKTGSKLNEEYLEYLDCQPEPEPLPDLQIPPYILVRMQGPYHPSLETEDSFPDLSVQLTELTQTELLSDVEEETDESTEL